MPGIVIVGSGLAGYTLARELRKLAPAAELTVISRDAGEFYSKPMLSNALAQGRTPAQLATADAAKMAAQLGARVLAGTAVHALDAATRRLTTSAGPIGYDQLALALGADPIRVPIAGDGAADVLSVNDLADYATFRERLAGSRGRIAILGAGLIGCEFANDLLATGHAVSVIDPVAWPLGRLLPEPAARAVEAGLAAKGVDWHFGTSVGSIDRAGAGYRLQLADGAELEAGLVLSAIGLKPRTALATAAGLAVNRGIVVDRRLATSKPGVYALGDCAEVCGLVLPFVLPLMQAARTLAATLAGTPTELAYPAMPVVVKTPAHPVVVAPPLAGAEGAWTCEPVGEGVRARFIATDGRLLGFALTGPATAERQVLTKELPAWLG